jgi:hypothetical protein
MYSLVHYLGTQTCYTLNGSDHWSNLNRLAADIICLAIETFQLHLCLHRSLTTGSPLPCYLLWVLLSVLSHVPGIISQMLSVFTITFGLTNLYLDIRLYWTLIANYFPHSVITHRQTRIICVFVFTYGIIAHALLVAFAFTVTSRVVLVLHSCAFHFQFCLLLLSVSLLQYKRRDNYTVHTHDGIAHHRTSTLNVGIRTRNYHYILDIHQYRSKQNHIRLFTWNITDTHAIRASYTPVIWSIFNLVGWHQFSAQTLALRTCMPCITICNMVEITMALA